MKTELYLSKMRWWNAVLLVLGFSNIGLLLETSVFIFNTGLKCIYNFYKVVLFVGYYLLLAIARLISVCYFIPCLVRDVFSVLTDDFDTFAIDISSSISFLWTCIYESCAQLGNSVKTFISCLLFCSETINEKGFDFIWYSPNNLWQLFRCTCKGVFDALSLIGLAASHIVRNIYYLFTNIPEFLFCGYDCLKGKIFGLLTLLGSLLTHEAMCGLIIITFITGLIYKLNLHIKFLTYCFKILFGLQLFINYYLHIVSSLIRRKWKNWRKVNKILQSNTENKCDLQRLLEQEKADKLCIICMDKKRNVILMNCKHLVLCFYCACVILDGSGMCPVCRTEILRLIDVYT